MRSPLRTLALAGSLAAGGLLASLAGPAEAQMYYGPGFYAGPYYPGPVYGYGYPVGPVPAFGPFGTYSSGYVAPGGGISSSFLGGYNSLRPTFATGYGYYNNVVPWGVYGARTP